MRVASKNPKASLFAISTQRTWLSLAARSFDFPVATLLKGGANFGRVFVQRESEWKFPENFLLLSDAIDLE